MELSDDWKIDLFSSRGRGTDPCSLHRAVSQPPVDMFARAWPLPIHWPRGLMNGDGEYDPPTVRDWKDFISLFQAADDCQAESSSCDIFCLSAIF